MSTDPLSKISPDFLIRASEYNAAYPDFKLLGRKDEMDAMLDVLLKKGTDNNLILTGQNGVGLSSLVMGLQASKQEPGTPEGIVGKNFFYLDVDALFSSSDPAEINEGFQAAMDTLQKSKDQDSVLIIEDIKGFLNGVVDNHVTNIVNILLRAARTNPHFQAIFVTENDDLPGLYKLHTDIGKIFNVQSVKEPNKDDLRAIVEKAAKDMGELYGVDISQAAVDSVLELTEKYPLQDLAGQPKRSLSILESTVTAYLRTAQTKPPGLDKLEETLAMVTTALDSGKPAEGDLADRSQDQLKEILQDTQDSIQELNEKWEARQTEIGKLLREQSKIADKKQGISDQIDASIAKQKEKYAAKKEANEQYWAEDKKLQAAIAENKDAETINQIKQAIEQVGEKYKAGTGGDRFVPSSKEEAEAMRHIDEFNLMASSAGFGDLEERLDKYDALLADNKEKYKKLTQGDSAKEPTITDEHVLNQFSRLSNVPMNKLQQDETEKLLHLADDIKKRVFGQDEPVDALADAVISAKAGLKKPNEPIANFMFLGPSGVGKTETAKALAEILFGDESAMQFYNMSLFQQDNTINTLIGSPRGFEGYAGGGVLTNNMIDKPYCVNLFDELEKAHEKINDVFLAMCDEGVVEDTRGIKAYFGNAINIFTSNFGAQHFLDPDLDFETAKERAVEDLRNSGRFKPEFLNRMTIFCYNRLGQPEIIQIANKNLQTLNDQAADKGISVDMPKEAVEEMCKQQYDPFQGGRGIRDYIKDNIRPYVAKTIFKNPDVPGVVQVTYKPGKLEADIEKKTREAAEANGDGPEGVEAKVKDKTRKIATISTEFIRKDAAKPAAQVPANGNVPKTAAANPALG